MSFLNILTLVFVVLKALGYLEWSWWLVFLPSIIWAVFVLAILAVGFYFKLKDEQ